MQVFHGSLFGLVRSSRLTQFANMTSKAAWSNMEYTGSMHATRVRKEEDRKTERLSSQDHCLFPLVHGIKPGSSRSQFRSEELGSDRYALPPCFACVLSSRPSVRDGSHRFCNKTLHSRLSGAWASLPVAAHGRFTDAAGSSVSAAIFGSQVLWRAFVKQHNVPWRVHQVSESLLNRRWKLLTSFQQPPT